MKLKPLTFLKLQHQNEPVEQKPAEDEEIEKEKKKEEKKKKMAELSKPKNKKTEEDENSTNMHGGDKGDTRAPNFVKPWMAGSSLLGKDATMRIGIEIVIEDVQSIVMKGLQAARLLSDKVEERARAHIKECGFTCPGETQR